MRIPSYCTVLFSTVYICCMYNTCWKTLDGIYGTVKVWSEFGGILECDIPHHPFVKSVEGAKGRSMLGWQSLQAQRPTARKGDSSVAEEEEMLKLAHKHRMKTDMHHSIFCMIMGSADCDDAFEKLVHACMLKNGTKRDTVTVLWERKVIQSILLLSCSTNV